MASRSLRSNKRVFERNKRVFGAEPNWNERRAVPPEALAGVWRECEGGGGGGGAGGAAGGVAGKGRRRGRALLGAAAGEGGVGRGSESGWR